jgi:NADPH2:quinone reductase
MRAVLARSFAARAALTLEEAPEPRPGPGQVLIAVRACGVNFLDGLIVEGKYQTRPPLPFSPGAEVAGVVKEAGAAVTRVAPGARVLAVTGFGGYAEQVVADEAMVMPVPESMDFATAACFPIVYATSLHALRARAQIAAGETLLVLGAAGGVGLTAVEIGKLLGARVIAAASTPEKLALCREYGADALINYADGTLREQVKELTAGKGVDVVYDPVGGSYAEPAVRCLGFLGRYLAIGFASGDIPKVPLNLLLLKQAAVIGVFWGAYARARPQEAAADFAQLFAWYGAGRLRPHLSQRFALTDFREALETVMQRRATGKVALLIAPGT